MRSERQLRIFIHRIQCVSVRIQLTAQMCIRMLWAHYNRTHSQLNICVCIMSFARMCSTRLSICYLHARCIVSNVTSNVHQVLMQNCSSVRRCLCGWIALHGTRPKLHSLFFLDATIQHEWPMNNAFKNHQYHLCMIQFIFWRRFAN